jgi:2-octaprenyl-6-methoxyphenol hydroxylase
MTNRIVVIGAGPTGLIFSLLNATSNAFITLLESRPPHDRNSDMRALALSNSSRYILEKINIWEYLKKDIIPIKSIHTSQKGTFGRTRLNAEEFNEEALGYIVLYGDLMKALEEKIKKQKNLEVIYSASAQKINDEKIESQEVIVNQNKKLISHSYNLLVLADGGQSKIEGLDLKRNEKLLDHSAIVTLVRLNSPHQNIAFERFTPSGPIALLPNHEGNYSLVWTGPNDKIKKLMALDDESFINSLQNEFGERAGLFKSCQDRIIFPLVQSSVSKIKNKKIVAIGNAAQTMHPVAGQGLNTGLRDALKLSGLIINEGKGSLTEKLVGDYLSSRLAETKSMLKITEGLTTVFSNDFIGVNRLRGLALSILDCTPLLKKRFVRKMSYGK